MLRSLLVLSRNMAGHIKLNGSVSPKAKDQIVGIAAVSTQKDSCIDYEAAVKQLYNLQSNAESILKARQQTNRKFMVVPNMVKFIQRSGLSMEDVDKMSVIHVSGTKGKGSTCAFCERVIGCHGYKTGLFSSPHLVEVRERIRINGRPIDREKFSHYFWQVYNRLKETESSAEEGAKMPAYFAFLTLLSLHVFIGEGVDVAIMEVGIGGQYDSTNFIRKPVVCGMTSLGLDHTALLGNNIDEIAWNKAGIFKKNHPAICVEHKPEAMQVVLNRAKEIQTPVYVSKSLSEEIITKYNIQLGIAGEKQGENAALAVQLFHMWEKERKKKEPTALVNCALSNPNNLQTPDKIPRLETTHLDEATVKGLCSVFWPGRAQTIQRPGITYYLDGAHTLESQQVCKHWFKKTANKELHSKKGKVARILVFNITGDRDAEPLLRGLQTCSFDAAVFCTNEVSTLESFNKADQLNKTVTSRYMQDRAEKNKESWDKLLSISSHESTDTSLSLTNGCHDVGTKRSLNNNVDDIVNGGVDSWSKKQKTDKQEVSKSQTIGDSSCTTCQSADKTSHMNGFDSETVSVRDNVACISHTFPCISQGLAWATDGRDPLTDISSYNNVKLPPVPQVIGEADHLQVLITGSLLLVGGVLTVIDPNMND